jgi:hypothetical protein
MNREQIGAIETVEKLGLLTVEDGLHPGRIIAFAPLVYASVP